MTILNNFLKTYTDRKYQYTVQVNHKGTVIAFAMDELRHIYYSVLDLENTQIQGKSPLDVNYWLDNPKEISFPNEIAQVGYAILPNVKMGLIKKGTREEAKLGTLRSEEVDPFLSTTARFTAQAPFQVLSDGKFIYVFRQAIGKEHSDMLYKKDSAGNFVLDKAQQKVPLVNETLLVDRYVLAGTELKLKMEVRYQRSRHKYNPQTSKDGLGAKDLEKKPFFEPTQELDFVRNLKDGRFSVLLLPTQIADLQRWQLFTHNSKTGLIDCFNVERSSDGLFNTKGTQLYTSPDPEYQNSVLERQPGTDSFTGEPLIPVISQSGYAESALDFDGQDDYVQLPALPENLFQTFTIETWVYYRSFSSYSRIFDFGNGASSDNILLLADSSGKTSFGIFIGGSGDYVEVHNILEINKWIHLAVAMDQSGNITLYKDGVIVAQKKLHLPQNLVRNQNYLGKSNWSGDAFFNGQMDEVRLWNRCRSQSEIKAALNQRLVGDEPGLWAYYRFDEGLGDHLHDQTENAMHATIQGSTWVKSDAPIGDHPGLQRTSFSLKSGSEERKIASGLASVLYHQQEKVATGYDQQEKPVKRNARVMLTVGTSNSATPDQNFIAAVDFAVSREGKIAQAPDCLTLPSLQKGNAANPDLDTVSRLQEEISTLKASINQLEISISALKASTPRIVTLEAQKARLVAEIQSLENDLNNKRQDIFNYFCRIRFNNNSGYLEADNSCNLSYQGEADRPGQYWEIGSGFSGGSKSLCPSNHLTTGSDYDDYYQPIPGRRGLASSESGSLSLAISPFSLPTAWWFNNYQYTYDSSGTTLVVDALVKYSDGQVLFNGKLTFTKTNRPASVITNAENAISSKRAELSNTTSELNKLYGDRTKLQEQESELALSKVQLENKETTLELARSGVQGEVSLPMSWLHTDSCGLTVAGGLLNFAYTQDTPLLVNGATGNVALYFRGINDQFFVTYYDTNTTKAQHLLEAETGKLIATARSAEPECDHATFTISDSDTPETCTLTITNSATKLEETWQHLPRDVEQFCNILNGGACEPIFIGKLEQSVSGEAIDSLTLSQRPKQNLAPGSILYVGNRKVVVTGTQSKTTDSLSALQLNGANTYVEVPYFSALNTNEFTISLWAKLEGGQGHRSPLTSRNNSPTQGYMFYASPSNQWEFWVGNSGGWDIVSSSDIALNVWNHLAATLGGNHLKLYVNGKLVAEKTIGNYSLNNGKPLRIGAGGTEGNPDYLFPGQIDEVQIWNKARSENEIQGDMNRRLTGNEPGLMGYWQFTGGSAKDYSPNGHHGQIFGQPSTVASAIQDKTIDGSKESVEIIAIAPISLGIPADAAVYLIPYDYEAWTSNNRTSNSLDQGSLQFIFQPGSSSGKVQNGTITGDDTTLSCQWVAESPGRALSFDGQNDYVKLADSAKLSKFDAKGDLTLEAWVRSAQLAESARVIHHHSANSQYTLGVQSKGSNSLSAIEFDGVDDYIELPAACIPSGNEITISFWAFGGSKLPKQNSILAAYSANNGKALEIHFPWDNRVIYFDCGDGRGSYDRIEKLAQDSEFKGAWSHWAFTKNVATGEMKIYLNGKLWHSGTGKTMALSQAKTLLVGGGHSWGGYYNGSLDELQIWNKVRSEAEIQGDMNRRLTGNEPGLMGYWQFTGGIAKDYSPNGYHGKIFGKPAIVASAIQDKQIYGFAGVGNLFLKSKESAPLAQWHHLSAVYNQSYALQFKGNGFLECDHNPTLDLDRDLSIEVFLQVGSLNQRQGILTKGKLEDGTTQNVPYSLYLDTDGKIAFAFEDKKGKSYVYKSREALQVGQFYKIAVTRQHQIEVKNQGSAEAPDVIVNQWADIRFYIAQKAAGYDIYKGADLDRNSQKLEIGKTYQGSQPSYFQGFISEVRLWNTVVDLANLGMKINGQEKGLIAWWRLEENEGNIASDSKGESHAVIIAAQWVKNPDPQGSSLTLYQNGLPVPTESFTPQNNWGEKQFSLGGASQNVINPLPTNGLLVYLTGDSYQGGDRWNDLSSRGNHASKASSFAMPSQYPVNDYNGKNFKVMRFNSNCGMTLPDTLDLGKDLQTNKSFPFTAIIVDRYYGNIKGRTLTSRNNNCNWLLGKHSGNNGCFMEGWVGSPYAATQNTFTISTVTLDGSTSNWFVDGVLKGSGGGITAPGKLGLCRGGTFSSEGSDADIAAILIWDRVLSESERHKVEKWLGEQYGIPISHPVDLGGVSEPFAGIMEEVRIWKVARTQEQIQDNLFSRIKGEKQDLIANYTFDLESQTELFDQSLMGNHLTLGVNESKPTSVLSTAPISQDTAIIRSALAGVKTQFHETIHSSPAVQEYSDLQYDIEGNLIGIQKRCYSYIKNGQWNLLTGYKVGNLITEWIGQVQADPQIIGYIEGAPPVPSENLTGEDPYNETSIQLVEADSVNYIYSSSKESGFDMSMETVARLGLSQSTSGGIGLETQIAEVTSFIGGKATFESSQGSVDEASVSYGYNTTKVSRLQTLGTREKIGSELNPYVGRRYVPNNVGLALVQSDTMDVFALRLAHNNALVSYRFLPNPDIPKDWNIITFPINPTYTKQGTLDGKIGLKEDGSVQADPHYPNAATYGQWSYFKPIEAYSLKKRIERQRQELATYYDQYSTFQNVSFQASGTLGELPSQKMATRNLVNTHVWTADGGFFSESTDVMEATSETTTGNYSFQGMAGLSIDLNVKVVTAVSLQLDALFGGHVATTKTKGRETEKSFAVEVEMAVERDIQLRANTETLKTKYHGQFDPEELGVYDAQGNPIKQPGKVDAYRFMTFYFEPTTENFEDFFGKVVDPIWLEQSSEPNAIALRQANQGDKKPSCWRIFHRVTFVSRILPEIAAQNAPPLEKAIRAANIESNWELIKKLEPFVQTKTQDFVTFADAVRTAIATYLPELQGYESSVIQYMALYYGLNEVV